MNVYLDNAATTKLHPKVYEAMLPYLKDDFGNPSSIHSFGRKVKVKIEEARETIANFINADPSEIYFVSGGTEAINFPLIGIAKTEFEESGKDHVITSKVEHNAVLETYEELKKIGFDASFLDVTNESIIVIDELLKSIRPSTSLLSLIHVNNETGAMNDIKQIASAIPSEIVLHSDTVQSFGKILIDVNGLRVDSISASAHKIYGPKGIGFTWVKNGTPLSPLHFGGSQERNRRGGTENVPGIIGLTEAVRIANTEMNDNYNTVSSLKAYFSEGIASIDKQGVAVNESTSTSPYILSITFKSNFYKNDTEAMLIYLDLNGIAAASGAACSSGALKPSHVMLNSGRSERDSAGTIRFSFSPNNTIEEIEYTLDVLKKMVEKFRK
ncbi:cysteine desulfurase family protein [Bacteroidota bacterium]